MVFPHLVVHADSCLQPYLITIILICILINDKRGVLDCETCLWLWRPVNFCHPYRFNFRLFHINTRWHFNNFSWVYCESSYCPHTPTHMREYAGPPTATDATPNKPLQQHKHHHKQTLMVTSRKVCWERGFLMLFVDFLLIRFTVCTAGENSSFFICCAQKRYTVCQMTPVVHVSSGATADIATYYVSAHPFVCLKCV